jgi:hypothetical protein
MATFITSVGDIEAGFSVDVTVGYLAGDLIKVNASCFSNNGPVTPVVYTCTDNDGNTYLGGFSTIGGGAGVLLAWWRFATSPGSVTITVTEDTSRSSHAIRVEVWRDAPPFSQAAVQLAGLGYTPVAPYINGQGVGYFNVAKSLVLTCVCATKDAFPAWTSLVSDTGDTESCREDPPGLGQPNMVAFYRETSAVGVETVKLKQNGELASGKMPMLTLVFSSPLPRAVDQDTQFTIRPGQGFENAYVPILGLPGATLPINRPLTADYGYVVEVGEFLVIGSGEAAFNTANTLGDAYGNTYTRRIESANGAGTATISLWTTRVQFIPPAGTCFQVRLTSALPAGSAPYQSTFLSLHSRRVSGEPTDYQVAGYDRNEDSNPSIRLFTDAIATVPEGSYMVGAAIYGGGNNQEAATWSEHNGWVIRTQNPFIQFASQQANAPRVLAACMFDKVAPADGSYDASADALLAGAFVTGGAIAFLAVTVPAPPPPPPILPTSPCDGSVAFPATDNQFELQRVVVTMKKATHLPLRGSAT